MSNLNGVLKFNQLGFEKKDPHRLLNRGLGGVFEAEQDGFGDWKTMKINQI